MAVKGGKKNTERTDGAAKPSKAPAPRSGKKTSPAAPRKGK